MANRLLVVDSDRRFIQDHRAALESAFEVDFLYATEGALPRLETGTYGAVLLCVETSENKGYALCSAIRRAPLGDLKIALISAKASEEEYARHRGTKGRADLYLHKPIQSTALVPALAELVPLKEADPDNPLGDLAGADLGDEWLESLKTELEVETPGFADPGLPEPTLRQESSARVPLSGFLPPVPKVAPLPAWNGEAVERGPQRTEGEFELLEWRVKDLELKLASRNDELTRKTRDIEELIQRSAAITRNLDAAEQSLGEVDQLRRRIQELDAEAAQAQADLGSALEERRRLEDRTEELTVLLAEKTHQNAEMLESHQLLQAQLEEAWEAGDRAKGLETALAEAQAAAAALEARAAQAEDLAARRTQDLDEARAEAEGTQGRIQELQAGLDAARTEAEGGRERIQGLQAELDAAREQVSFQDLTIRNLAEERRTLQADRERQDEALAGLNSEVLHLKEELASRDRRLEDLEQAHEARRAELVSGIEEREARLESLSADLETHRARAAQLELDRQTQEGRLQALTPLLEDLEGRIRQALDHARG